MHRESLKEKSQGIEITAAESPNGEQTLKSRSNVPIAGGRQGPSEQNGAGPGAMGAVPTNTASTEPGICGRGVGKGWGGHSVALLYF